MQNQLKQLLPSVLNHYLCFWTLSLFDACECDPALFSFINQGALTVEGIDDVEEMRITDVRVYVCKLKLQINLLTNDTSLHSSISLIFVGSF